MICPYCGEEMQKGKCQNITMHNMTLIFQKEGEKVKFRDLFKDQTTGAMILGGSEMDAFYCDSCNKIVVLTDGM